MPIGFPGLLADCMFKDTVSGCAFESIPFGVGVQYVKGTDFGYALPGTKSSVAVITGEYVTGNSSVTTYNGGALAAVPFNTSHEQTVKDVVAQLQAEATVVDAYVADSAYTTIVVITDTAATAAVASIVVTGGATQPTWAITSTTTNTFWGIAQYEPMAGGAVLSAEADLTQYLQGQAMNVLRRGRIYVTVEEAVAKGDPVYWRVTDNGAGKVRGQFRKSADTATAVLVSTAIYTTSAPAGGYAVIELNP